MNRIILAVMLAMSAPVFCLAQDEKAVDALYHDFSNPDVTAFGLLGVNPNKINRPTTTKEFASSILEVGSSGKTIPPGIAIEWAPGMTFSNRFISPQKDNFKTFDEYVKDRFWRQALLSFATIQDSTGSKVALGLNICVYDHTDPSYNRPYFRELINLIRIKLSPLRATTESNAAFMRMRDSLINDWGEVEGVDKLMGISNFNDNLPANLDSLKTAYKHGLIALLSEEHKSDARADKLVDFFISTWKAQKTADQKDSKLVDDLIAQQKAKFKKEHWNDGLLKIGAGNVWNSSDFTWKQLQAQKFSSFVSWCGRINDHGFLQNHMQFVSLFQYSYDYNDSSTDAGQFAAGGRVLLGSYKVHGSFELAYQKNTYKALGNETARESQERYRSTLGLEFRMNDGLWIELATGIDGPPKEFLRKAGMLTFANVKYTFKKENRFSIPE